MRHVWRYALGALAALVLLAGVPTQNTVATVADLATLRTTPTQAAAAGTVWRATDGRAGAPPMPYAPDTGHVCSADDGGRCVAAPPSSTLPYWLARPAGLMDIRQYSAVPDNATDNAAAISACAATGLVCLVPQTPLPFYIASQVTVPSGGLVGQDFAPYNDSANGFTYAGHSAITCSGAYVGKCILVGGGGTASAAPLVRNLIIAGKGAPAPGNIGIEWTNGFNVRTENVFSVNHDICVELFSDGQAGHGNISYHATTVNAAACASYGYLNDGWPEEYITNSRYGMNGSGNTSGEKVFAFQNTAANTSGAGPNTFVLSDTQINPGSGSGVGCVFSWQNMTSLPAPTNNGIFKLSQDYIELLQTGGSVFCSDPSVTLIHDLKMVNSEVSQDNAGAHLFAFAPQTALKAGKFVADSLNVSDITLSPNPASGPGYFDVSFVANFMGGATSFTTNTNQQDRLQLIGNHYNSTLTLASATQTACASAPCKWQSLLSIGETAISTFTNTAAGAVTILDTPIAVNSNNILTSGVQPNVAPFITSIPYSGGAGVPVANGASYNLAVQSGLIIVDAVSSGGSVASYMCGGSTCALLGQSKTGTWVASTTTPTAGAASVAYNGAGNYAIYNNIGSTVNFTVGSYSVRTAN